MNARVSRLSKCRQTLGCLKKQHKARKRRAIDPTDHMVTVLLESFMKLMLFIGNGNVEIL